MLLIALAAVYVALGIYPAVFYTRKMFAASKTPLDAGDLAGAGFIFFSIMAVWPLIVLLALVGKLVTK